VIEARQQIAEKDYLPVVKRKPHSDRCRFDCGCRGNGI
jgi:hypothetical protein